MEVDMVAHYCLELSGPGWYNGSLVSVYANLTQLNLWFIFLSFGWALIPPSEADFSKKHNIIIEKIRAREVNDTADQYNL